MSINMSINMMMMNMSFENKSDENKSYENKSYEVKGVAGYRQVEGKFEFNLQYKGFKGEFWTPDKDCSCEELILDFLRKESIKTVYCICRVSTKKQAGPTHVSLDLQAYKLSQLARRLYPTARIKIVRISASAYQSIPKQLQELGALLENEVLLFHSVDRVSRNIVKFLGLLEDLNARGTEIYAMVENIWYSEKKLDFIQGIVNANREAEAMSRRIKQSLEARRERGDDFGCSYGFKLFREEKTNRLFRDKNPEEQKVISKIMEMYGNRFSVREIVAEMNKNCKKRGRKWTMTMVQSIIYSQRK